MNAVTSNSMTTCPSSPYCSSLGLAIATNSSQNRSSYFFSQRLLFSLQERAAISRTSLFFCFLLHNHQGYQPTNEHALNYEEYVNRMYGHLFNCAQEYMAMDLKTVNDKKVPM